MSTIDELMDKDPLELSSKDIDEIIAYERKQRGLVEAGVKPKKAEGEKKDLDINALLSGLTAAGLKPVVITDTAPKPRIGRRI